MQANRSGMSLTPMSIFLHQTIAELALAVERQPAAGRGPGSRDRADAAHASPAPLPEREAHARRQPLEHLDAGAGTGRCPPPHCGRLSAPFCCTMTRCACGCGRRKVAGSRRSAAPSDDVPFESHDVSPSRAAGEDRGHRAGLHAPAGELRSGPRCAAHGRPLRLWARRARPALRDHPPFRRGRPERSVFWEDLEQAYRQADDGASVSLPPKTTSFSAWAIELERLAQTPRVVDTAREWLRLAVERSRTTAVRLRRGCAVNTNGSAAVVELELSAGRHEETVRVPPSGQST